jgi:hypothetical protein
MLFNILQKPVVGGQCEAAMACAFHCLLQAFERDIVVPLYECSEHIYQAGWLGL